MVFAKTKKEDSTLVKNDIKNTLVEFMTEMSRYGYNRIPINISEISEDEAKNQRNGGWQVVSSYYPKELFYTDEITLMESKKSYQITSIIADDIPSIISYPLKGVEIIDRIRIFPMLPQMVNTSPFYYQSNQSFFSIENFIDAIYESGISTKELKDNFAKNVVEYNNQTFKLFNESRVYDSLSKLNNRQTESDHIFDNLKQL